MFLMLLFQSQKFNVLAILLSIQMLKSGMKSLVIYNVLHMLTALHKYLYKKQYF